MDLHGSDLVGGVAESDIEKFLETIHPTGVFELRAMDCPDRIGGTYTSTASGYFASVKAAASWATKLDRFGPPAVYVTVNRVKPELLARSNNRIKFRSRSTATDDDMLRRCNLFIDIDAEKQSGISASDSEMRAALEKTIQLRELLTAEGWPQPILGMSGNGGALLYRIDMPVEPASQELISRLYTGIVERWGIAVDKATHNAARLSKVFGTTARKGDELKGVDGLEDRLHRRSWYVRPDSYEVLTAEQIEDVAACSAASVAGADMPAVDELVESDPIEAGGEASDAADVPDDWQGNDPWSSGGEAGGGELFERVKSAAAGRWGELLGIDLAGIYTGSPCPKCGGDDRFHAHKDSPQTGCVRCRKCLERGTGDGIATYAWLHDCSQGDAARALAEALGMDGVGGSPRGKETIPLRPDLYVAPESRRTSKQQLSSNKHMSNAVGNAKRQAAQLHRMYVELRGIVDEWTVERVLGEPNHYRLSGDFFESVSSPVNYLEADFDTLYSLNRFNRLLGSWKTGSSGLIPSSYEKVWESAVDDLTRRAINIEGHNETRMTSLVAERIVFLIECRSVPFHAFINPQTRKQVDTECQGVIKREYQGQMQYLLDFTKLHHTIRLHFDSDVKKQHVTQALNAAGSRWTWVNAIGRKFRSVGPIELAKLGELSNIGKADTQLELQPSETPPPAKPDPFADESDYEDAYSESEYDEEGDEVDFNFGENVG